jgi:ankyrin repeat protein
MATTSALVVLVILLCGPTHAKERRAYEPNPLITYCVDVEIDENNKEDYEKCKHAFAQCQNNMEVHRLLEKGHDPNIPLDDQSRSIIILATFKGQKDIVAELLNFGVTKGLDVNQQAASGHNALMYAAAKGYADLVTMFLNSGGDKGVNAQITSGKMIGYTPLHWAAATGNVKIAKALMNAGGNPGIKDETGASPLDLAKTQHPTTEAELKALFSNFIDLGDEDEF